MVFTFMNLLSSILADSFLSSSSSSFLSASPSGAFSAGETTILMGRSKIRELSRSKAVLAPSMVSKVISAIWDLSSSLTTGWSLMCSITPQKLKKSTRVFVVALSLIFLTKMVRDAESAGLGGSGFASTDSEGGTTSGSCLTTISSDIFFLSFLDKNF